MLKIAGARIVKTKDRRARIRINDRLKLITLDRWLSRWHQCGSFSAAASVRQFEWLHCGKAKRLRSFFVVSEENYTIPAAAFGGVKSMIGGGEELRKPGERAAHGCSHA